MKLLKEWQGNQFDMLNAGYSAQIGSENMTPQLEQALQVTVALEYLHRQAEPIFQEGLEAAKILAGAPEKLQDQLLGDRRGEYVIGAAVRMRALAGSFVARDLAERVFDALKPGNQEKVVPVYGSTDSLPESIPSEVISAISLAFKGGLQFDIIEGAKEFGAKVALNLLSESHDSLVPNRSNKNYYADGSGYYTYGKTIIPGVFIRSDYSISTPKPMVSLLVFDIGSRREVYH